MNEIPLMGDLQPKEYWAWDHEVLVKLTIFGKE